MGVQGMFVGVVVLSCTEEKFEKINKAYKKCTMLIFFTYNISVGGKIHGILQEKFFSRI